ncbi:MAG: hypothetical protein ABI743_12615, partial [bacterium]
MRLCLKLLLPLLAVLGLLGGCGRDSSLTSATPSGAGVATAAATLPEGVGVLGALTVRLDPARLEATAIPARTGSAYGDNYWLNATGFLAGAPCKDCFGIQGVRVDGSGNIILTIRAAHPFAPGDPGLPITGKNRLDLHVFDAAVLVANDLGATTVPTTTGNAILPARLVRNAAGYSPLLTSVIAGLDPSLTSTVYPYVTLNEDRTTGNWAATNPNGFADLQAPTGRNVFPMGADVTSDVVLGVEDGDGPQTLTLLFTCAYGASVHNRSERLNPVYPLPEFNTKAPWRVELTVPSGTNGLEEGSPTSSAAVNVKVWDWQQGAVVDATLADIGAVRASSNIASVELSVPDILTSPLALGTPVSGTGPLDDPLVYSSLITNQAGAVEGDYLATVIVRDDRTPGLNSGGQTDALSSQIGTTIDPVTVTEFATYQCTTVHVAPAVPLRNLLSIAITPSTRQIIDQGAGSAITCTAIGTFDAVPINEDISGTVTWNSSATDVATFASNICTGIGMGTTTISATQSAVTSPGTKLIVKPVQFLVLTPPASSYAFERPDANQTTGDLFLACSVPANSVRKYQDDGTFLTSWSVTGGQMNNKKTYYFGDVR